MTRGEEKKEGHTWLSAMCHLIENEGKYKFDFMLYQMVSQVPNSLKGKYNLTI
jgi:hypothetical protein